MCPTGTPQRPFAASAAATTTTTTTVSSFRPAFEILDTDHDGKISRDDLRSFYKGFSTNGADEDVIGTMMTVADSNKNGFVEYDEFESVIGCRINGARKRSGGVMEDVFKVMDKDNDGKLSHADLKNFMNSAGFSASDEDVKAMIRLGGGDENEGVSYDGLLKILAVDSL